LKPPNVMLRENDSRVLIDFGLARQIDGLRSTRVGILRGSPYYMSPEQALGEELDVRSDLYSLGVIYYELLTGKKPYVGQTAIEVLQQHVNAPVPPLPERLARHEPLLSRMLAKDREARCSDAVDVMQAIAIARPSSAAQQSSAA
jgi:serine/threonine protein kinase